MDDDYVDQMRAFIILSQNEMLFEEKAHPVETKSEMADEGYTDILLADLEDLAFRLRGFMETAGGDYALGVETGMQQAATMVENLIRRHREGGSIE
jgi:hypothetical protein